MAKKTLTDREKLAVQKLDASAVEAQERITAAASKAQKMIDDACDVATAALEQSSRIPDRRNLNGSFQWDRGDRYRRGSDERIQRLEDKVNGVNKAEGLLEVGAAQRVEQIISLREDCKKLGDELQAKKIEIDLLADDFDASQKEISGRLTTLRELVLEVKEGLSKELEATKVEFIKQQAELQSNIQWKLIAALSSLAFLFILVFISYSFHVFGGLP